MLLIEARKLRDLEDIRAEGGPFVSSDEVDVYLSRYINNVIKQKCMRREVRYARDTCHTLPKSHTIFKMFDMSKKPRKLLTPQQFGYNLKVLLWKREECTYVALQEFRDALDAFNGRTNDN